MSRLVAGLVLSVVVASSVRAQESSDPLARVMTIGASLTAGFGTWLPVKNVLQSAIHGDVAPIRSHHDVMFFRRPTHIGKRQVDLALRHEPTLVVALDFLFWYGYGYMWVREEVKPNHIRYRSATGEEEIRERVARLEKGLAELDRLKCKIVVGDFPNMAGAHSWMISASQIPSEPGLAALNERLHAWAAERTHVHVVPLAASVAKMRAGAWTVTPPGGTRPITLDRTSALQWDRLHPTRLGVVYLSEALVASMREGFGLAEDRLRLDVPAMIEKLALAPTIETLLLDTADQ